MKETNGFIRTARITLVFIFLVILAGSVVRSSGAGMGCPDWPKCFGKWIPPTDLSELPADYQERFSKGEVVVAPFNPIQTWTEYVNRLVGALTGIFILLTFIKSLKFRQSNSGLFYFSLINLILIGFQGWLGAKVVSSNLAPFKITIHMVVALVILSIQLYLIHLAESSKSASGNYKFLKPALWAAIILSLIQILLGTQVREMIDTASHMLGEADRESWVEYTEPNLSYHRLMAWVVLLMNSLIIWKIWPEKNNYVSRTRNLLAVCLITELAVGLILVYGGMPAFLQPAHLMFSTFIFSLQFYLILKTASR